MTVNCFSFKKKYYEIKAQLSQDEIKNMSAEKFSTIKKSLKVKKLSESLTLADQFWIFFKEIASQQFHFNRKNVEASLIRAITHAEVVSFFMVKKKNNFLHLFY